MSKLLLPLAAIPACLRDSLRACLKVHKIELPVEILIEASNNMAMGLISIDQAGCDECGGTGVYFIDDVEQKCICTEVQA